MSAQLQWPDSMPDGGASIRKTCSKIGVLLLKDFVPQTNYQLNLEDGSKHTFTVVSISEPANEDGETEVAIRIDVEDADGTKHYCYVDQDELGALKNAVGFICNEGTHVVESAKGSPEAEYRTKDGFVVGFVGSFGNVDYKGFLAVPPILKRRSMTKDNMKTLFRMLHSALDVLLNYDTDRD